MLDLSMIEKHMEVVGSDGQHVGTVDKLCIKMTKMDPAAGGVHHIIPIDIIGSIADGKLMLSLPAADAIQQEKAVP